MRGWHVTERGHAECRDGIAAPTLDPDDPHHTLVEVHAAAANFADRLMIDGQYQLRPRRPFVPGFEVAGVVTATNDPALAVGTRVAGVADPNHGAWAEVCAADSRHLARLPDAVDWTDAIGLVTNGQTAWFALHRSARIDSGDTVLVHAAAGGVGSMAVQLAKAAGCVVVGTASSTKLDLVRSLGADHVIDNRLADWAADVRAAVGEIDVVVDPVGEAVFEGSWKLLAIEGRYIVVGFASGIAPNIRSNHALVRNVSIHGMYWTPLASAHPELVERASDEIFSLHRDGRLDPCVTVVSPAEEALDRLADVSAGRTTGKSVLTWR
jgi:NADPH2:quinone reductase